MIIVMIAFVGLIFAVITKDKVSILALYDEHKRKNK
jgi:hypothetical protein